MSRFPVHVGGLRGAPADEGGGPGAPQLAPAAGGQHQGGESHEGGVSPGLGHGAHRAAAAAEERPPQPQGTRIQTCSHSHMHPPAPTHTSAVLLTANPSLAWKSRSSAAFL